MTISVVKAPEGTLFTDVAQTELPGTIIVTETGPETITAVHLSELDEIDAALED